MVWDMSSTRPARPSPTQRLLDAAGPLFAREGIRAVGVDRVLAEAGVARASLYHAFGSKDGLIAAYIDDQDRADRGKWEKATVDLGSPQEKILAFFDLARAAALHRGFRGCLYLNAATEFPDPEHPARHAVARHRAWLQEVLLDQLAQIGVAETDPVADRITLFYDGALAGSKFDRSTAPIELARDLVERLIADHRPGTGGIEPSS